MYFTPYNVNFQKAIQPYLALRFTFIRATKMQDNLNIITQFGNKVSEIIKVFADLCRDYKRRQDNPTSEFQEMQDQLVRKRKQRMELEDLVRQKMAASNQTDTSLSEIMGNQEERKRPKTAFALFLADQRIKMMKESPTLSLSKISGLATIKWKKLPKEQQQIYERKLLEMNKLPQSEANQDQTSGGNDRYLVKKEHLGDSNERIEQEHHDEQQQRKDEEEKDDSNQNQLAPTAEVFYSQNEPAQVGQEPIQEANPTVGMLMDLFPQQNREGQEKKDQNIAALTSNDPNNNLTNEGSSPKANFRHASYDLIRLQPAQPTPATQE